jgi:hypothetical protein
MLLSRVLLLMASVMRHANGVGVGGGGQNSADASQPIPLRANCRKFQGMGPTQNFRSALVFRRSQVEAELRELVEGD